ncbi:MAG TPA: hypothetical protein VIF15_08215 [Polyangiaceae bacterium]|jgi:urease accessory protein UreF
MTLAQGPRCCVCGQTDARALVEVSLRGGAKATLCGSHAVMHRRSTAQATSATELRALLRDRRGRRDRREEGDELGAALTAAFSGNRRGPDRRVG